MAITIDGSGTISGISAGGLPDGCVTADDIGSLPAGSVLQVKHAYSPANTAQTSWSLTSTGSTYYGAITSNRTYSLAQTINITPSSTNSKLVCFGEVGWSYMTGATSMAHGQIITLNDTTSLEVATYPWYSQATIGSIYYPSGNIQGVFEPNSTSEQTIRLRPYGYTENSTGTAVFTGSSLIVMEIA